MPNRRERYESANMRGGMGVRKRLSEDSFKTTYRLNGVQRGATINECYDKYGRWELGFRSGVLVRKTAHWVTVKWDDEDELAEYEQGDARYKVDRELWKITNPRIGDPLEGSRGVTLTVLDDHKGSSKRETEPALTGAAPECENEASANADDSTDRGAEQDMASRELSNAARERQDAQKALKNGELKEREVYTAKQVAYRCGTDAKTMRKFFRSKASTVEPVGQGGRYEFDAADMPKIKSEFDAWRKKADQRTPARPKPEPVNDTVKLADIIDRVNMEFMQTDGDHNMPAPLASDDDDYEPTPEELAELEDIDIDDLDGEDI